MDEYGALEEQKEKKEETSDEAADEKDAAKVADPAVEKKQNALMQQEERAMGAVSLKTYVKYSRYAGGLSWAIPLVILLLLSQGASGTWHSLVIHRTLSDT
jgi:ATP-binding cassette subfamily C (CFTR/MRP) protein 1